MTRLLRVLVFAVAASGAVYAQSVPSLNLGVDGPALTVNGAPRFLVFVSYFDGLDVSNASLAADFAWLKSRKVDGIRVFPNWWNKAAGKTAYSTETLFAPDGTLRPARLRKLRSLLTIARTYGLVVDLSISGENVKDCVDAGCAVSEPFRPEGALTKDGLAAAIKSLVTYFERQSFDHVLLDLQNEVDYNTLLAPRANRDTLTAADIKAMRNDVRSIDPAQLLTASISGGTTATDAGVFTTLAGLDVAAWHETREESWWAKTADSVASMRKVTAAPIYLQEPMPSNEDGWSVEGAIKSLQAAKAAGAAAWTFHTRASFEMNGTGLKAIVASNESALDRDFLNRLPRARLTTLPK